jgi:hypothetical protein
MFKFPPLVLGICLLAACSGNPFAPDTTNGSAGGTPPPATTPPETTSPAPTPPTIDQISGTALPPGTASPTPTSAIVRLEATGSGDYDGNGFARGFRYVAPTPDGGGDTFYVEGLAFDGGQPDGTAYTRVTIAPDTPLPLGTGFAAYEGPSTVPDFLTGDTIDQLQHRAIYGVSTSGRTQFAIVRTGAYSGYGFGGFIYQRNDTGDGIGVVMPSLPTQGQATYSGPYAGLRDFNGTGGLEYVTGAARMDIDFGGFSGNCTAARCADAVRLSVTGRQIFNEAGEDITEAVWTAINTERSASLSALPVLRFKIGTGVLTANGEITGSIDSTFTNNEGRGVVYEEGNYYAIMAGDHTTLAGGGGEVVGIVVVEGEASHRGGATFRETGGFIVQRGSPTP